MKFQLSKQELKTVALLAMLGLVVLWVYSTYLIQPTWRQSVAVGKEVRDAKNELRMLKAVTANEDMLRQQQQALNETVTSLRHLLPGDDELPAMIETLSNLANQSQVKINTIFPQRPLGKNTTGGKGANEVISPVYKEIPIQIDAQAGYHQLGTFLGLVEASDKLMHVSSLRISSNPKMPKRHLIKMVISAYFLDAPETAAGSPRD